MWSILPISRHKGRHPLEEAANVVKLFWSLMLLQDRLEMTKGASIQSGSLTSRKFCPVCLSPPPKQS